MLVAPSLAMLAAVASSGPVRVAIVVDGAAASSQWTEALVSAASETPVFFAEPSAVVAEALERVKRRAISCGSQDAACWMKVAIAEDFDGVLLAHVNDASIDATFIDVAHEARLDLWHPITTPTETARAIVVRLAFPERFQGTLLVAAPDDVRVTVDDVGIVSTSRPLAVRVFDGLHRIVMQKEGADAQTTVVTLAPAEVRSIQWAEVTRSDAPAPPPRDVTPRPPAVAQTSTSPLSMGLGITTGVLGLAAMGLGVTALIVSQQIADALVLARDHPNESPLDATKIESQDLQFALLSGGSVAAVVGAGGAGALWWSTSTSED